MFSYATQNLNQQNQKNGNSKNNFQAKKDDIVSHVDERLGDYGKRSLQQKHENQRRDLEVWIENENYQQKWKKKIPNDF